MEPLFTWAWSFLVAYILAMIAVGILAGRRVHDGDDYAVARRAYGPVTLALAFAATTASGATFLGMPGLTYSNGFSALWYPFCYPLGVYIGVILCMNTVTRGGDKFGSRSIPEYLGDHYQSEFIRLAFSIFSLLLLFYLAGQLVAGLVMFEQLLGLSKGWALSVTAAVLLLYIAAGGAHADIITDGIQGFAMLLIALLVTFLFLRGIDVGDGTQTVFSVLADRNENLTRVFSPENKLFDSPLTIVLLIVAHIPLGMLPHIGNKLWALNSDKDKRRFIAIAFVCAMILPCMAFGGLLARAVLGDDLLGDGLTPNSAIPSLFIAVMPAWLAALLSVAILSAIMSTADGLIVSASQVFANDLYRRSLAPRLRPNEAPEDLEKRVLAISRWSTVVILIGSAAMAWALLDVNIALIVWIGIGGMNSALAGPLVLGSQWSRVNRPGAIAGMLVGISTFIALHTGWFAQSAQLSPDSWLAVQSTNPFTCTGLAVIISTVATIAVSLTTAPPHQSGEPRVSVR